MPIMKLYSKKGDDGKTSILGSQRFDKDHIRISSYGTIDELNSVLGIVTHYVDNDIKNEMKNIQSLLFEVGSELASITPRNTILSDDVTYLEKLIDKAEEITPKLKSFILPGGSNGASWLHFARTVARRVEREIVSLNRESELNPQIIPWINRLSDLLFSWARLSNFNNNIEDTPWRARGL